MELKTILKELSIENYYEKFKKEWDESETLLDTTDILSVKFISENAKLAGIDKDTIVYLINFAKKMDNHFALKRLFIHMHYLFFLSPNSIKNIENNLPEMEKILNKEGFTYNLLLALSGANVSKKYFNSLNMPKDVSEAAIKDISLWVTHFKDNLGVTGLSTRILNWERRLMRGSLFRLGRLQFNIRPFGGNIFVFRNKITNRVQALIEKNIMINSSGQFDGIDNFFDDNSWKSVMERDQKQVIGNPVTPEGNVLRKTLCLRLDEWNEALSPGDPILDIHIPAGRGFSTQACADSMNYALEFFPRYFPEKTFKGWACHSWFLDNQYEKILPNNSNILKFQHELYLYPIAEGGEESYKRIFGENGIKNGIKKAPQNNSMQKSVAEFIEKGGRLRAGGGFFLKRDMPWGKQFYKQSSLPSLTKKYI